MKFKVDKMEEHPNCVTVNVTADVNGKEFKETFNFSHEQIANDQWKEHVKIWLQKMSDSEKLAIPDIAGKEIEV